MLNNRLYFPLQIAVGNTTYHQVWYVDSYGRLGNFIHNSSITRLNDIYFDGDYWWLPAGVSGEVYKTSIYSYPGTTEAVYESLVFGDADQKKKLLSVGVSFEKLRNVSVKLEYMVDGGSSIKPITGTWTEVFTHTTNGTLYHEAVNIESTGEALPEFREIQFRITSDSGAVITGLKFTYEEIDSNPGL